MNQNHDPWIRWHRKACWEAWSDKDWAAEFPIQGNQPDPQMERIRQLLDYIQDGSLVIDEQNG